MSLPNLDVHHKTLHCLNSERENFSSELRSLSYNLESVMRSLHAEINDLLFEDLPLFEFRRTLQDALMFCAEFIATLEEKNYKTLVEFCNEGYLDKEFREAHAHFYKDATCPDPFPAADGAAADGAAADGAAADGEGESPFNSGGVLYDLEGNKAPCRFVSIPTADGAAADVITDLEGRPVGIACKGGDLCAE